MGIKLKDILAISGKPGLYKFLKQGRNGIIVEGMEDKKRLNAHATAKVSSLEDITIYTEGDEDKSLSEVMKSIYDKENGGPCLNPKKVSNEQMKSYFEEVLPEYDKERVYISDLKKVYSWYNVLQKLNMLEIEKEEKKDENEVKQEDKKAKTKDKKESEEKIEKEGEKKEIKKPSAKPKSATTKAAAKPKTAVKTHSKPAQVRQTQTTTKNK